MNQNEYMTKLELELRTLKKEKHTIEIEIRQKEELLEWAIDKWFKTWRG